MFPRETRGGREKWEEKDKNADLSAGSPANPIDKVVGWIKALFA